MTGPLGAGPFYHGKSRAIKIPPCGPTTAAEPVPPGGAVYYGKSRAIKAGFDTRNTGPRPPVQAQGPIYHGISRALKVRSCPVYVAGASYGPDFEGNPVTNGSEDAGFVTSFQGVDHVSWLTQPEQLIPPSDPMAYSEVERLAADGEGVFVQGIEGNGVNFQDNWFLAKYDPAGNLLWGPIRRSDIDSFHIACFDGRVFTAFDDGSLHPIMLDASDGTIIYEYDAGGTGYKGGAAKGPGDTMYVAQNTGGGLLLHRVGPGGIEASSAPLNNGTGTNQYAGSQVDYYGGAHPDRNRFYAWRSILPGTVRFEEWQGYPTVEYIRTVLTWPSSFSPFRRGPDAIAVDEETGNIYTHGEGLTPFHRVNGYDADGLALWEVSDEGVEDDATQMAAKNGQVYVAGFTDHPELTAGLLPALVIFDATTGAVMQPTIEFGQDSTESSDIYGLAAV